MELVTVYIPTFNRLEMLKRALTSVFNQTYKCIEVIVVDDGSTDGTREYLESIQRSDVVCIFNDVNSGPCVSRNKAIAAAKGKYITGLDDDDEFLPDHVEVLVGCFDDKFSLVTSSLVEVTSKGNMLRTADAGVHCIESLMHYNKLTNQALTLTERMRFVSGFDESLPAMQDYDVWVRLVEAFGPALKIRSATYVWHTGHEEGRISKSVKKRDEALRLFYKKHENKMSEAAKKSFWVLKKKMLGERLSLYEMLRSLSFHNWRMVLSFYLNSNDFLFKKIVDRIRLSSN